MSQRAVSLIEAVNALASEAGAQLEYLRGLGLPDGIDELALEFDAIAAAADDMLRQGELNQGQYDSVKKLDDMLARMSAKTSAGLWTPEALRDNAEWSNVRSLAKETLRALGQTL